MEIVSSSITISMTIVEAGLILSFIENACRDDTSTTSERTADELRRVLADQLVDRF